MTELARQRVLDTRDGDVLFWRDAPFERYEDCCDQCAGHYPEDVYADDLWTAFAYNVSRAYELYLCETEGHLKDLEPTKWSKGIYYSCPRCWEAVSGRIPSTATDRFEIMGNRLMENLAWGMNARIVDIRDSDIAD